jgi:hypothetical protein
MAAVWVALIQTNIPHDENDCNTKLFIQGDHHYLLLTSNGGISAWKSEEEAVESLEGPRKDCLNRGGTWAASAVVHAITFRPSIIRMESEEDLIKTFFPDQKVGEQSKCPLYTLGSVSGSMTGLLVDELVGEELWENGRKCFY